MTDAPVDWRNEARTLIATGLGVRETARQLGLPEDRVKKWASRSGIVNEVKQARQVVASVLSPNVPTAAEVLANLGPDSKRLGAIVLNRSLRRFSEMHPDDVIDKADKFKAVVSTGTPLHGWGADKPAPGPLVSFTFNALPIVPCGPELGSIVEEQPKDIPS